MAEQVVIVCDVCGAPATSSVAIAVQAGGSRAGQRFAKDLCDAHLTELIHGTRKPRRGRRRGSVASASDDGAPKAARPRGRPKGSKSAAKAARRGRPKKAASASASAAAPRRRGRPPKAASAAAAAPAANATA
jgi:hypothetical protein